MVSTNILKSYKEVLFFWFTSLLAKLVSFITFSFYKKIHIIKSNSKIIKSNYKIQVTYIYYVILCYIILSYYIIWEKLKFGYSCIFLRKIQRKKKYCCDLYLKPEQICHWQHCSAEFFKWQQDTIHLPL